MRNKQAKALRKQSRLVAEQQNIPQAAEYDFQTFKKVFQSLDGKYHSYTVYTASLKDCQRKILKALKKEFKPSKA